MNEITIDSWFEYDKGTVHLFRGNLDDALHCFNNSLKLDPNNAIVLFRKAVSLARMSKYEEADKALDKAIK